MARKRKRRRRGAGLGRLLGPLSVMLAVVVVVAALTMFFKVGEIEVSGNSRYTGEQIAAATGVEIGDNLVLLDKYGITQRLFVDLPYITEARINRRFPSTLTIDVTETQAAASVSGAGVYWLISRAGKLLEPVEEEQAREYLVITGAEADAPAAGSELVLNEESPLSLERLKELLGDLFERDMLARTEGIDMQNPNKLVLLYDNRFQVEMYYDADFDFKLTCLEEAVEVLQPNETGILRMTMDNELEVRFIRSD
ncbi:MAG: FtsQ-type POTRA domain-containing protein [Oscillospiraceae bacterium]|nr:FtsQ-type POTRA domain-containing protein [Oscillospiraceae bacterium]